jgi:hypothetical protein
VKNQFERSEKSNCCNLLPYSYDFYSSGPIQIMELEYDIDGNLLRKYVDISNAAHMDFDSSCLTVEEKVKYDAASRFIPYESIETKLELRKKNLNKSRGKTSRI